MPADGPLKFVMLNPATTTNRSGAATTTSKSPSAPKADRTTCHAGPRNPDRIQHLRRLPTHQNPAGRRPRTESHRHLRIRELLRSIYHQQRRKHADHRRRQRRRRRLLHRIHPHLPTLLRPLVGRPTRPPHHPSSTDSPAAVAPAVDAPITDTPTPTAIRRTDTAATSHSYLTEDDSWQTPYWNPTSLKSRERDFYANHVTAPSRRHVYGHSPGRSRLRSTS